MDDMVYDRRPRLSPSTFNWTGEGACPTRYFARSRYRFSDGSTVISSPSVTNGGTCTTTPFSSVAGLYDADAVAPFTIGSVDAIFARIVFGSSMPIGFDS